MSLPTIRFGKKAMVKVYVAYCLCMDSDVFIRLFGHLSTGGAQLAGFQSANPVMLLFSATLVASTVWFALPVYRRVLTVLLNNPWITALYCWTVLSVAWAVEPGTVVRLAPPLWAYMLCGVVAGCYLTVAEAAEVVGNLMSYIALVSALWERLDPIRVSAAPGWTGVFGEKNHLGMGMGVGIVALLAAPRGSVRFRLPKVAACGVLLLGSRSTTALVFVLVSIGLYALLHTSRKTRWIALATTFTGAITLVVLPGALARVFALSGKDTTFTGRNVIWRFVWDQWLTRPALGFGYANFWTSQDALVQQTLRWNPGSAHNGFLEVLVTTGVGGEIFLLGALAAGVLLARLAWRNGQRTAAIWLSMAWLAMMIDDITEADFLVPAPLWFTYCLVFFLTYAEVQRRSGVRAVEPAKRYAGPGIPQPVIGPAA